MPEPWEAGGFGLYLHWPFCQAKCPYCDFNSHVVAEIDRDRWQAAYLSEIRRVAAETGPRILRSVYFGGGTPSLMAPEIVAAVLDTVRAAWPVANNIEITLEANPTSVEAGRFRAYRDAGVNRVSIGIQALNNADLRALGRLHTVEEARAAFELARDVFPRVSFDLIYARQNQSLADWRAELAEALTMAADHLSLYQLTIEPGTAFGERFRRGKLPGLPDEDLSADMFDVTQDLCAAAGLPGYEVSNHARPGAESRHNLIYWRAGDYIGIGPGAHGRLTLDGERFATDAAVLPVAWLRQLERTGAGEKSRTSIPRTEQLEEALMMGLRLAEGIDLGRFEAAYGFDGKSCMINMLVEDRLICVQNDRLCLSARGRPLLNAVLRQLILDRDSV